MFLLTKFSYLKCVFIYNVTLMQLILKGLVGFALLKTTEQMKSPFAVCSSPKADFNSRSLLYRYKTITFSTLSQDSMFQIPKADLKVSSLVLPLQRTTTGTRTATCSKALEGSITKIIPLVQR